MKGIILAGGSGTRLNPLTIVTSKQLLPIYDKPMVYYPLSTLMLAGIRDILIISTPEALSCYKKLLGKGDHIGLNIDYIVQEKPEGLPQAFILAEDFIGDESVCLILGDNFFYGNDIIKRLSSSINLKDGAILYCYRVKNPQDYGVAEFDTNFNCISLEEKPITPKSNYAVTGLYFYDNNVVKYAKTLKPSSRKELEICDLNNIYLKQGKIKIEVLSRGFAWLDTGSFSNLLAASNFVKSIQSRQGRYISCIEEIAYKKGFISKEQLMALGTKIKQNDYGKYLLEIAEEE